jgi:hypothetical protein
MTTLSERTQGPSDRTHGLAARLPDHPKDAQEVSLIMVDGTSIRGVLHRAPGTRTLDFLNRQAETFVAITDAIVAHADRIEHVPFVAINKSHIVQVIEGSEPL